MKTYLLKKLILRKKNRSLLINDVKNHSIAIVKTGILEDVINA